MSSHSCGKKGREPWLLVATNVCMAWTGSWARKEGLPCTIGGPARENKNSKNSLALLHAWADGRKDVRQWSQTDFGVV